MLDDATKTQIKPGAMVRVFERVKEGDKERLARFEGLVLARKHGSEPGASFTVRGAYGEIGVEKVYPLHSPIIDRVEIISTPKKIHRSKLYFARTLSRKSLRRKLGV